MLGILFTLPDSADLLASVGSTSAPIVSDFMPLIELVAGIALGIFVVYFLISMFLHRSKP